MAGTLTDFSVAARLAVRSLGRRLRSGISPPPDLDAFRSGLSALLARLAPGVIRDLHWVDLPARTPPWLATGIQVEAGDRISWFCAGRVYASRFLDIYVPPALQVWGKIGEGGTVFRGTRDSHSFTADRDGELLLGNYFPNDWSDPQGNRLQNDSVYRQVDGGNRLLIVRWVVEPLAGLQACLAQGDPEGRISAEIARLETADPTPAGWQYLWHLGPAEIFSAAETDHGKACVHCTTHGDVGILQKAVDLELTASTEISWQWRVDSLPSAIREDSVPSHDYLSIAVEFDNGRDITYHWSAELPVDAGYDCPLPNWRGKEYHVVIRSGAAQLGQWLSERRNLHADYRRYMGEPPGRIVRVWFIANSLFQRGRGECRYAEVALANETGRVEVV